MSKWRVLISSFVLVFLFSSAVYASDLIGANAFWSGGFKKQSKYSDLKYYYLRDNPYRSQIQNAMSTFSSISGLNFGFSEADWALDADVIVAIDKENAKYHGMGGVMVPCNWSESDCNEVKTSEKWDTAAIFLFQDYMERERYTSTEIQKVVSHEFGHVYSLVHQLTNTKSLMYPERTTITKPSSLDISNLKWKY
ncbi:hypothetical protein T458_14975 [Brevibacillus panacihumi W25]|uniref:Peptidase M10 metallopeptidase domain-containing protein n=1 Tax=Brevibacillus panacihumi W25 TaxID=1408254 RepID=V6M5F6_9BACL|nr:matrixin family metalloprotease [Brevibacillus panacihumi]EST53809.1 hypothetical protein T458_14975 [Brevibacillus panacihumi W25]